MTIYKIKACLFKTSNSIWLLGIFFCESATDFVLFFIKYNKKNLIDNDTILRTDIKSILFYFILKHRIAFIFS